MPNYCYNEITIEGNPAELKKQARFVKSKESDFDFNKIAPYPEEYAELDRKAEEYRKETGKMDIQDGFNSGGYFWCINNWGTKWKA